MKSEISAKSFGLKRKKSLFLVNLMLISLMSPLLIASPVSAHQTEDDVIWEKQGSNDTGWIQLDAVGGDPSIGLQASANWELEFAPGAEISNLTMEIRVDGSNNLMIEEPVITASDIGINLFDWSGLGMLGSSDSFDGLNPHSGRLSPNSEAGASWTLPAGAEITELIVEALAPVDPAVSFEPVNLEITDYAIHFVDGRLYLAVSNSLLIIDYNNNPKIIDIIEFQDSGDIIDIEIDATNLALHVLTSDDFFHAISLIDTSELSPLPDTISSSVDPIAETVQYEQFYIASDGNVYASNQDRISVFNGAAWTDAYTKSTAGEALDIIEAGNVLYFSFENEGVVRWNMNTNSALSTWTTANNLHSDSVTGFLISGNQLLMASEDSGLARYDWSSGFWLSTWSSSNWLNSNYIGDLVLSNNILYILSGDALHSYNTANGIFQQTYQLSDFGLNGDAGDDLILWPNIGSRSPANDLVLVSDGFGLLAELTPGSTPLQTGNMLIASGPTSASMQDAVELDDVVFIAADGFINRYDTTQSRWLNPTFIGDNVNQLATDGSFVYIAGQTSGAHKMHSNGSLLQTWDTSIGLDEDEVISIAVSSNNLVALSSGAISKIDLSGISPIEVFDIPSIGLNDLAIYGDTAYIATDDIGLARFDLNNDSFLAPWGSTGVNNANSVPLAVQGDILHLGLPGYGVVRKDLSTETFIFPKPIEHENNLSTIIDELPSRRNIKKNFQPKDLFGEQIPASRNRFQKNDELNDFFIFCDTRDGHTTIHSWDIKRSSKRDREICMTILKNRRKSIYGPWDGNPMSFEDLTKLISNLSLNELHKLVKKDFLKIENIDGKEKFELRNTKNSAGIFGVYRVFMPSSEIFSTITATENRDFIALEEIKGVDAEQYKKDFIDKIYKPKKFRLLTGRETARLQGFPDSFKIHANDKTAKKHFGNAVPVNIVSHIIQELIKQKFI